MSACDCCTKFRFAHHPSLPCRTCGHTMPGGPAAAQSAGASYRAIPVHVAAEAASSPRPADRITADVLPADKSLPRCDRCGFAGSAAAVVDGGRAVFYLCGHDSDQLGPSIVAAGLLLYPVTTRAGYDGSRKD